MDQCVWKKSIHLSAKVQPACEVDLSPETSVGRAGIETLTVKKYIFLCCLISLMLIHLLMILHISCLS